MGKTVSFVATDKLAEWLEEESERRMTTLSSTAQQLLAEKYREEREMGGDAKSDDDEDVLAEYPEKWWEPDGDSALAVRLPNGDSRYFKTREGGIDRLRREYEAA